MNHPTSLTFHLIPHTHWDREWYLTRAAFQARLIPVLDDVLHQLERVPEARFVLDGQTVLLEDYLAARPENAGRLSAQVKRGALEIGPWYVLSDLLIPSAHSLRRNLEAGARDAARFGKRLDVLYSPDAFGHPAELPALAAEFGLRWAVVRRGLGRPSGVDRDFYRWQATGSASVLVYHLPASGYDAGAELAGSGDGLAGRWAPIRRELVDRAVTDHIAVFIGADHHAMVPDLAGLKTALQAIELESEVRISGLAEFFAAVERSRPDAPAGRGELRRSDGHAWVLQDVHSARSRMKRHHTQAELLLSRIAEPLARLAGEPGGAGWNGLLRLAWRTLLQSQFHDTLAGTAADAVLRGQDVRLESVLSYGRETATACLHRLAGYDADLARSDPGRASPRLVLWNPSERPRGGIAVSELTFFREDVLVGPPTGRTPRRGGGARPFGLVSSSGESLPVQVLAVRRSQERRDAPRHYPDQDEVDRVWVGYAAPEVTGLGLAALTLGPPGRPPGDRGLDARPGSLRNRLVAVTVSPRGELHLADRESGNEYSGLCALEDEPDRGDLYTFSQGPGRPDRGGRPLWQAILAAGPLVAAIETRWSMTLPGRGSLGLRQVVALHADSGLVRIRLDIENAAINHRLRAWFPVGAGTIALAGTAFGVERRAPVEPDPDPSAIEQRARTAPAHRYVSAGHGGKGLAVLAPGFFEYEWTSGRRVGVTLLRAVGALAREGLPERPGRAGWPLATPEAQEPGLHTIHLALLPAGTPSLDDPEFLQRHWEEAFLPVQSVFFRDFVVPAAPV